MFHSLWEQEYTRRRFTVTWTNQGSLPQIGDIVLFKNEPIYKNPISAARVEQLLRRKNGDVYGATISYRCEVGGRKIVVDRHLNQLFPFMNLETQNPQETIHSLTLDSTEARNLVSAPGSRPEPTLCFRNQSIDLYPASSQISSLRTFQFYRTQNRKQFKSNFFIFLKVIKF